MESRKLHVFYAACGQNGLKEPVFPAGAQWRHGYGLVRRYHFFGVDLILFGLGLHDINFAAFAAAFVLPGIIMGAYAGHGVKQDNIEQA